MLHDALQDNSMSGTNHEINTFYGSGSQNSERITGLNNIYEPDIGKLTDFLQNNGQNENESGRALNNNQGSFKNNNGESDRRIYQSNHSKDIDFNAGLGNFHSYSKVEGDNLEKQLQEYENGIFNYFFYIL